jgi:hypothetical protein
MRETEAQVRRSEVQRMHRHHVGLHDVQPSLRCQGSHCVSPAGLRGFDPTGRR